MVAGRDLQTYRRDVHKQSRPLTPKAREELIKPYLPSPPSLSPPRNATQRKLQPVRTFLKTQVHLLVYTIIHTLFSLYIRLRQTYHAIIDRIFAILYYHHRTPELIQKDVRGLSKLPQHLSVILELKDEERGGAGLEALVDDVAEISAWCACVGIPMLSIYERTGTPSRDGLQHPRTSFSVSRIKRSNPCFRHPKRLHPHHAPNHLLQVPRLLWPPPALPPDPRPAHALFPERRPVRRIPTVHL